VDAESMDETIDFLDKELHEIRRQVNDGYLKMKPDETVREFE
jgi:hypothetical protein